MKLSSLLRSGPMLALAIPLATVALHAAAIDVSIINPNRIGSPGDLITFTGTITNNTDDALASTDLFLNFSSFDPLQVTLNQLLGLTSFSIADGATSPTVDLFTFGLSGSAAAGTYPALVTLETAVGDLSDPQTVSVTVVVVPEPGSFALIGIGALVLFLGCLLRRRRFALLVVALLAVTCRVSTAQISAVRFVTTSPGLAIPGATLMVSLPLTNDGTVNAINVQVTGATLQTAPLTAPASFPVALGTIPPAGSAVFEASFNASALAQNTQYLLTVRGTYEVGGLTGGFAVNRFIQLPPTSPGFGTVKTVSVGPNFTTGAPFPPQPPLFDEKVNSPRAPVPTGPFVPGIQTPSVTGATPFPSSSGGGGGLLAAAAVIFNTNVGVGIPAAGTNCSPGVPPASCAEPTSASGGGVVFVTANWTAAYSTNGGGTFTQINPTTIFPADAIGFCCDQIVQYVPSIDRFIWLLQGNGMRIASASPAQIISSGGTAWTYWNLTPNIFGQPAGTGFDYPDVSVGTNNLYLSWDVGFPSCPPGCNSGLEVVRIPLAQIMAGGTIFFDFTTPSDSSLAWGSHLTQDTGPEIFWAGHDGNSSLRVFSLAEGSNTYFWRNVGISSWPNNTLSSTTPDGQDWLKFGFPGNGIIGATRSSNQLWFAWTAGTNNSFQQPHVEIVTLDRGNNFSKIQQVQIWNNSYAFAYPALATNVCTGEIGLSLGFGGNGNFENHVVGIWGDFVVYVTTGSNLGVNRYGDYMSIRQNGPNGLFDASGYGISSATGGGMQSDVRYVVLGRSCIIP
jgi:PEP-CTERM motif